MMMTKKVITVLGNGEGRRDRSSDKSIPALMAYSRSHGAARECR